MMRPLPMHSIRFTLMRVILAVTVTALFVAGAAMAFNDWRNHREALSAQLRTTAQIISRISVPALSFDDKKTAAENLSVLAGTPSIRAAALYTPKGELFASYVANGSRAALPKLPETSGLRINRTTLALSQRILAHNEIFGTLYLEMRNDQTERLLSSLSIVLAVMLTSMLAGLLLSIQLEKSVTAPLLSVARVARHIVDRQDFSLRAPQQASQAEAAVLVEAFNAMLDELGTRAGELEESNVQLAHEINDRRNVQDALQLSEERSRALVSAIAAVTWVADRHGGWHGQLAAWEAFTAQSEADYQGFGWRHCFHSADRTLLDQAWATARQTNQAFNLELRLWHAHSGEYRFVNLSAVPSLTAQGELREWVGAVSDIHDRRTAEEEVRRLNAELELRVARRTTQLEDANRELESFSYSVSHDLRAPVRAVSGFSKILSMDHAKDLDSEGLRLLNIIQNEALRMGSLIDDLLTFSRLGRKALKPAPINMQELARSVLDGLCATHTDSVPEITIGALPDALADRSLLLQVWSNLFTNALKFSAKVAQPKIEVGAISEEKEHIYFVRDNGAGFDSRFKAKLFGVFQRLHDSSEFSGTGVGLALVLRIVSRHGGRVWAEGELDRGATFYFTLPRNPDYGSA